jgi:SAM-dependent methyltransferase
VRRYGRRVSFDVEPAAYTRFMGRYSEPLAVQFADLIGVRAGQRALDVGCGAGALTAVLVSRLGAAAVSAAEPEPRLAAAVRERLPGVDVRQAPAGRLPFPDASFDAVAAQLVVHFMADPVAGLAEMARVAKPDGTVAACVWDYGGDRTPLALFWRAARELDPAAPYQEGRAGGRQGHLVTLFGQAGLAPVRTAELTVSARQDSFGSWWEPFTQGVGPAGDYLAALPAGRQAALRERCRELVPDGPFEISATAWAVAGRAQATR